MSKNSLFCFINLSHLKTNFIAVVSLLLIQIQALAGTITVTSPNGGESWNSCTPKNITWSANATSGFFNIYYSLDNGSSWVGIATSFQTSSGSFPWNLPNVSSVNCLVKVEDALATSTFDVSNSVFIINGALIVLSPNGGENYITGSTQNIVYSYLGGTVNNIKIEYSFGASTSWNLITSSTPANGSYPWVIPNTPSSNVKIRLTDVNDPGCKTDTSNAPFSITSTVTLLNPNGGQSLQAVVGAQGNTIVMNNSPEKINTASFYDNGGLVNNYSNSSFIKTIIPDFPTNKINVVFQSYSFESGDLLRIYNGPTVNSPLLATLTGSGSSNFVSTHSSGALTFSFVSDGDNNTSDGWDAIVSSTGTSPYNITWSSVGTSKYFDLDYSINNGSTWVSIVRNLNVPNSAGSYLWQVPNTPSTQCLFRITDAKNSLIRDTSNANFTILQAQPFSNFFRPMVGRVFGQALPLILHG